MNNPKIAIDIILACYGTLSINRRPKKPKRKTLNFNGLISVKTTSLIPLTQK